MATALNFAKMHGLGNDFVIIDAINQLFEPSAAQVRQIADRRFGVGCDQLLLVERSDEEGVDFGYRIFNSDGGEVEQCGNGARCFARFVKDRGLTHKDRIVATTSNGRIVLQVLDDGQVAVDMGAPTLEPELIPFDAPARSDLYSMAFGDRRIEVTAVALGNPHLVLQVDDVDSAPVATLGSGLGKHVRCPSGANIGFMQVVDRKHLRLRVFERGVGETLACGSGACAAAVAGRLRGLTGTTVKVALPGGELTVTWPGEGSNVRMCGPAVHVYDGKLKV